MTPQIHILPHPAEETEGLLELRRFLLSKQAKQARLEFVDYLVLRCLPPDSMVGSKWVYDEIKLKLPGRTIPEAVVSASLRRLAEAKLLERGSNGNEFRVVHGVSERFSDAQGEVSKITERVYEELLNRAYETIPQLTPTQAKSLLEDYRLLMSTLFTLHGYRSAELIFTEFERQRSVSLPRIDVVFHQARKNFVSLGGKYIDHLRDEVLWNFIRHPDENQALFWYVAAQSYLLDRMLQADSRSALQLKEYLQQRVVYLDTNLVYALLLSGHRYHREVQELVKLTRELGVSVRVTTSTHDELHSLLYAKFHEYNRIRVPRAREIGNLLNAGIDDDYFVTFLHALQDEPLLSWEEFSARLSSGSNLVRLLVETLRLEVVSGGFPEPDPEVMEKLVRLSQLSGSRKRGTKTRLSAEHDVFHYLLINHLRELDEHDLLGTKYWFLTFDYSLLRFDSHARRESDRSETPPFCLTWDVWAQSVLLPFVNPRWNLNQSAQIFANLVASEALSVVAHKQITADKLRMILNNAEVTGMDSRLLGQFISSEFMDAVVSDAQVPDTTPEPELLKLALQDFQIEQATQSRDNDQAKISAQLEQTQLDLQRMAQELARKDETITELVSEIHKDAKLEVAVTDAKEVNKAPAAETVIGSVGTGIGAATGAAVGSLVLPGIGTVIGAAVGGVFGFLFSAPWRKR